jgi:hypothetical protein
MSAMTIVGLIAGYLGLVGFALALLTVAKRSEEAAERHARAVATRRGPPRRPHGAVRDAGLGPDDADLLEGLRPARPPPAAPRDQRAAREFERRRFVRQPTPVRKRAPRDS